MIKRFKTLLKGFREGYGLPVNLKCPKCHNKLYREIYIDEYPYVCLDCEENFYFIERCFYDKNRRKKQKCY